MPPNPSIRASDRDRDRTAELLREHHAVGRLDPVEFAERLDQVYEARTIADLDVLTADLPAIDLYPLPTASLPSGRVVHSGLPAAYLRGGRRRRWRGPTGWPAAWSVFGALLLACLALRVAGAALPIIGLGAVGVLMLAGQLVSRRVIGQGGTSAGRLTDRQRDGIEGADDQGSDDRRSGDRRSGDQGSGDEDSEA